MAVTTEQLLTHPKAFGLASASPVQRAICRAADGFPLAELKDDPDVQAAFGGLDKINSLPTEAPKELYVIAAIRGGKSLLSAALALRIALTVDLSALKTSEIARVSVVSLDKDKSGAVMEHLMGALQDESGALKRFLVMKPKPTGESVYIRRKDGRLVRIVVAAGRRAGASLVSRWTVAAIFDEAARMNGAADGVISFDESRKAVILRLSLLKGGQLIVVSSPHAARGPVYERVKKYRLPTDKFVCVQATGPQINPAIWTPEAVEQARATDEAVFITDVLGRFADVESGLFIETDLDYPVTREAPVFRDPEDGWFYTAAMDPATKRNAWTLVIVGYQPPENGDATTARFHVAFAKQWTGSRLEPLKAKRVLAEIAGEVARYGLTEVHTDQWSAGLLEEIGEDVALSVKEDESTTEEKDQAWLDMRNRVVDKQVELAPIPLLIADLLSAKKRLTPNGVKIELPVTVDGRHADYAPALKLAIAKASLGPNWGDMLARWRNPATRKVA